MDSSESGTNQGDCSEFCRIFH